MGEMVSRLPLTSPKEGARQEKHSVKPLALRREQPFFCFFNKQKQYSFPVKGDRKQRVSFQSQFLYSNKLLIA